MRYTLEELIKHQEEEKLQREEEIPLNDDDQDYYDYYSWIQEEYCGG